MIISHEMWEEIKRLEQEVMDLKQFKKASCLSKYYIYKVPQGTEYYAYWQITYKDGDQPIISEVLSDAATSLSTPSGNTQFLFAYSHMSSTITILSTREIQNVVGISG